MVQPLEVRAPDVQTIAAERLYAAMGLSDHEYGLVVEALGRKPNYTETGVFSVMWSEHCSYKTSRPVLRKFPTTGPRVLMGPGEGAGVVDIGDGLAVVFKIESHNHPSAIEPYQGAATGVGGIIRDIVSIGARPVALLDSLRFGPLTQDRVRYLFERVVAGIAGYGNCIGIPTVGGEAVFDESYAGNPLVNVMCVGVIDHDRIQRGVAKGVGNPVLYVGPPTGRDGIHGATFASEELTETSEAKRPAVQVGDPFMGKQVMEASLDLIESGIVVGIQDMGAAGLTSSSAEMASKAGNGIELWLDRVPQREEGMTPYEMMLSESQERMLVVVAPGDRAAAEAICAARGVVCAHVGEVRDDGRLRLIHRGQVAADMPVTALVDQSPVYDKPSAEPEYYRAARAGAVETDAAGAPPAAVGASSSAPEEQYGGLDPGTSLQKVLASPTVASKEWVYRQFDHMVGAGTYVLPGSDAAVVRVPGTTKALAMTVDCNGRYVHLDPAVGGKIAVAEAARNLVCSGAEPLAVTDNLNFGNPDKPEIFWQLEQAADGIAEACRVLQTPVVSGNVSLYNEHSDGAIHPTPVIGMVGLIEDLAHITRQGFRADADAILLLGETFAELGGSELERVMLGSGAGRAPAPPPARPPHIDLAAEKRLQYAVTTAIRSGLVASAHDLSEGGLAVALAESCMSGGRGARVELASGLPAHTLLFSESQSRVLLSAAPEHEDALLALLADLGVPCRSIGTVHGSSLQVSIAGVACVDADVGSLERTWKDAIPCLMRP